MDSFLFLSDDEWCMVRWRRVRVCSHALVIPSGSGLVPSSIWVARLGGVNRCKGSAISCRSSCRFLLCCGCISLHTPLEVSSLVGCRVARAGAPASCGAVAAAALGVGSAFLEFQQPNLPTYRDW